MDSLFVMHRYWGSDEENNNEEGRNTSNFSPSDNKAKFSHKKQKLDIPIIDIDSEENCKLSNKKGKLDSSVIEISSEDNSEDSSEDNSEDNSEDECSFSNTEEKADSSVSDSDVEIMNDINNASSPENMKIKTHDLKEVVDNGNKIATNKVKRQKLKDTKLQKSSKKSTSEEFDASDMTINNSNLTESIKNNTGDLNKIVDADNEIESKISNKQKLKRIKLQENNKTTSPKHEVSNVMADSITLPGNKRNKSSLNGAVDASGKIGAKVVKKQKIKDSKLEENGEETAPHENDKTNSEEMEVIDQTFCTIGQIYQQKDEKVKHALPNWLSNPTYISVNLQEEETPISELSYLDSVTKKNLKNAGISFLFPVQLAVIPWLMQSKEQSLLIRPSDICVSAPTGSGKTLAFVLPIVQSLKDRVVCAIRALVVLPVSELAIQVYKVFDTFVQGTELKVALLTGKKSFVAEQNALVKTNGQSVQSLVDIVVTTPGRVHDHIYRTKGFCLKRLRYLVIDEADRMMEEIQQGWLKQVEDAVFHDCIFSDCVCSSFKRTFHEPTSAYNFGFISQPLQKLLYSATLTHDPEQLHSLSLYKPKLFTASSACSEQEYKGSCTIPSGLTMLQVMCKEGVKPMVICHLVKLHNFKRVLCFTETVERAHRLHLVLEQMGLQVREISSFNRAIQRKIALGQFSSGKVDILVCSDLVSRGIDIENIDCVISYDVPQFVKTYIHRIGRTARAGKTGTAITLLSEGEIPRFRKILKPAGIKLPEKVSISSSELKPLVNSYQTALSVADAKLKKERKHHSRRPSKKTKRKLE